TFHAGTENAFRAAGNQLVFCLPHAVESAAFAKPEQQRVYELGWVGSLSNPELARRRAVLPELTTRFRCNDHARHYGYEEMAAVLLRSKIGLNIPRDDSRVPANLRCFEVMAAGALLLTEAPSDLTQYGFVQGQ